MGVILQDTNLTLWNNLIKEAERECASAISHELEDYLARLLHRYLNQSDLADRVLATAYLEAMQLQHRQRAVLLQVVGDECLLFAGFFPSQTEKKHVNADYFVQLGRKAYTAVSYTANDLCGMLASHFVLLADILQTIRREPDLLPLEAYERWEKTGSQRAYKMLLTYVRKSSGCNFS